MKDFKVSHVACGAAHTLLIDTNGLLYSTGSNSCGQLGRIDDTLTGVNGKFTLIPLPKNNLNNNSKNNLESNLCAYVSCGEEYSCVITRSRSVFVWGLGIVGQMGDGKMTGYSTPHLVQDLEGKSIDSLSCSQGKHCFASVFFCHGNDWFLQLDC